MGFLIEVMSLWILWDNVENNHSRPMKTIPTHVAKNRVNDYPRSHNNQGQIDQFDFEKQYREYLTLAVTTEQIQVFFREETL